MVNNTCCFMRKLGIIFLLLIITFCNCKSKQSDFEAYWSKVPVITLPLNIECGLCGGDSLIKDSIVEKYSFANAHVIGRIEDRKNIYLIYSDPGDICYPYLFTYSKEGKIIDSLYLHIGTCAEDEYLKLSTSSVIKSDKSIEMADTERYYTVDTVKDKRFLVKTVITKRIYKMDAAGIPSLYSNRKDSATSHTEILY